MNDYKLIKEIPDSETGNMVTYYTKPNASGDKYLITHCPFKKRFTLWKCLDGGYEKISESDSPLKFKDMIPREVD